MTWPGQSGESPSPLFGEELEESYRKGHVIYSVIAQAKWRGDEFLHQVHTKSMIGKVMPSPWAWALHCKTIKEEAFRS